MFEINHGTENITHKQVDIFVENYVGYFANVWRSSNTNTSELTAVYSSKQKLIHENDLEKFLNIIKKEAKKNGFSVSEQLKSHEKYSQAIKSFLKDGLNFSHEEIEILFSNNFLKVTSEFIEAARVFNPSISPQEIFQALRNIWTMNWIQLLLNIPVELTPSVFAYSMLYPYTDNYLDDSAINHVNKINFNKRLSERLNGNLVEPVNTREQAIYDLIGMIESQYDRSIYPEVFDSLFAIHSAQVKSLWLTDNEHNLSDNELLNISLEKGGTSVLADGYLVAGNLTEEQKIFLFGYGAYLQLIDDLQDVREDSGSKFKTIFSSAAEKYSLDKLINQTHDFGERVLTNFDLLNLGDNVHALEIMKKSNKLMLIGAVAITSDFYSPTYIKNIEKHSPFHFTFLRKQHESLQNSDSLFMNFSR